MQNGRNKSLRSRQKVSKLKFRKDEEIMKDRKTKTLIEKRIKFFEDKRNELIQVVTKAREKIIEET